MTANQINYAKHKEDVRTHLEQEEVARRNATSNERQAAVAEADSATKRDALVIQARQAAAAETQAAAAMQNAAIRQGELLVSQGNLEQKWADTEVKRRQNEETIRHNKVDELNKGIHEVSYMIDAIIPG